MSDIRAHLEVVMADCQGKSVLILKHSMVAVLRETSQNSSEIHIIEAADLEVRQVSKRIVECCRCGVETKVKSLSCKAQFIYRAAADDMGPENTNTARRPRLFSIGSRQPKGICEKVRRQRVVGTEPTGRNCVLFRGNIVPSNDIFVGIADLIR